MSLGLSGTFLVPEWQTPCASTWPRGQNSVFSRVSPIAVWPNNCLKINPVADCFFLTEQAWLPTLSFLKQGSCHQLLTWGPFELQGALDQVTTVWYPAPQTHSHSLLPQEPDHSDL